MQIAKLAYSNSGNAILALASNGIHLFWKWPSDKLNPTGKVQYCVLSSGYLQNSHILVRNESH